MRTDCWVDLKFEPTIRSLVDEWRLSGGIENKWQFNIVHFVENVIQKRYKAKGELQINFYDQVDGEPPAYVTYKPLTLNVDRTVWDLALRNDPDARWIIAHETGHIILHDHTAKPFSRNPHLLKLKNYMKENSAEWQADTWAFHLLMPDFILNCVEDAENLAFGCNVTLEHATKRFT